MTGTGATIEVGPYVYTDEDARQTLARAERLLDALAAAVPPTGHDALYDEVAARRAEAVAARALAEDDLVAGLLALVAARDTAAAALRSAGVLGPDLEGTVTHLAAGDGGVPKASRASVEVGWDGVVGDRQADRRYHGRPWQGLCLWSTEVIDAFVAGGDTLAPGRAGENVTLSGLPWERARPGVRLRLGSVLCEVWAFATPCRKNAQWFADGRFDRMHARHGPVSRAYALVLEPGAIAVGDPATLLTG